MARSYLLAIAVAASTAVGCSKDKPSPAPVDLSGVWSPGIVRAGATDLDQRGWLDVRGIIHSHSVYSYDACDGTPFLPDGKPDPICKEDLRRGVCQVKHAFVMLSDHRDSFVDHEFPDVLQYEATKGDQLVQRGGAPVSNWMACEDGEKVLIMAGTETGAMPVGLERHVGADPAARSAMYATKSAEAFEAFKQAGAVVLAQHTEDWTVDELVELPFDGFEMYNLHANMFLSLGEAMKLMGDLEFPELLPHPDLVSLPIMKEDPIYLKTWGGVLSRGVKRVTILATDAHRNSIKGKLPDGERVDSYRRMMLWFSNHLLVTTKADGTWDDLSLKEALRAGRLYGVFEHMGYASGFDYHALEQGAVREMGQSAALAKGVELRVSMPQVQALNPTVEPPQLTAIILKAKPDGWEEIRRSDSDLVVSVDQPGAYRAEVRMLPRHLKGHLGPYSDLAEKDFVWIYSNPIYVE